MYVLCTLAGSFSLQQYCRESPLGQLSDVVVLTETRVNSTTMMECGPEFSVYRYVCIWTEECECTAGDGGGV